MRRALLVAILLYAGFVFAEEKVRISIVKSGSGSGSITANGMDCEHDCLFDKNSTVTIAATPGTNSTFEGWSGANCSGTGSCVVNLAEETTVTANFAVKTFAVNIPKSANNNTCGDDCSYDSLTSGSSVDLVIAISGSGHGSVVSVPAGIKCTKKSGEKLTGKCKASFPANTSVQLTANPDGKFSFAGWSSPCAGKSPCVISLKAAKTKVEATFK